MVQSEKADFFSKKWFAQMMYLPFFALIQQSFITYPTAPNPCAKGLS